MANDLMSVFDVFNNKTNLIGFTDFFDDLYHFNENFKTSTFPPYNIYTQNVEVSNENDKNNEKYNETHTFIQLACAGYDKNNLKVQFNNKTCVLTVYTNENPNDNLAIKNDLLNNSESVFSDGNGKIWYHKGIATRSFRNSWKLNDKLELVKCSYNDGLLTIEFKNKKENVDDQDYLINIE